MSKIDNYISALEMYGDGRFHYYDGRTGGIGCSDYAKKALIKAGIIKQSETFHAASNNPGVLEDTKRFRKIEWKPSNLQRGDILWSAGHHVATWDGVNGVYEAAPEKSHGVCDNGKTGVGRFSKHTYYNCGTGTITWTCIYRIIDDDDSQMDQENNLSTLAEFLPDIEYGSSGVFVKALQLIMKKYGWYGGSVDGNAGPLTIKGIKLLQTALGVPTDGFVVKETWVKLLLLK